MANPLFNRSEIVFRRDRRILPPTGSDIIPDPIPDPSIDAFNNARDVIGKAEELEASIITSISILTIPVENKAIAVQSAVRRRDKESDGKYITFDLYMDALKSQEAARDISSTELALDFSLDKNTDTQTLAQKVVSKRTGTTNREASFILSQSMHLFKLQMMQGGLEALIAQLQTVTKLPNGTESPVTLASLALSIAFLVAYTDNTIDQIKEVFKELSGGRANIDQAVEMSKDIDISSLPIANLALESKKPGDYDLIISYVDNFLATTRKIGYEPWMLLADVRRIKAQSQKDLNQEGRYSPDDIDPIVFQTLDAKAQSNSRSLDRIATALTSENLSLSELCSLDWLTKVPREAIRLMQGIIEVALGFKAMEWKKWKDWDVSVSGWGIVTDILYDILEVFAAVSSKLLCWFQMDPDIWNILYECPPIGELVDAAITGLEDVEKFIFSKLDGVLDDLARQERAITIKTGIVLELKKMRQQLKKMEFVARSATSLAISVEDLLETKIDTDVFESAGKRLNIVVKEKSERLRDFVKRPFKESGFLSVNQRDMSQHFDVPTVPFPCNLRAGLSKEELRNQRAAPDNDNAEEAIQKMFPRTIGTVGPMISEAGELADRFGKLKEDKKDEGQGS